jgi:hypothetical protein
VVAVASLFVLLALAVGPVGAGASVSPSATIEATAEATPLATPGMTPAASPSDLQAQIDALTEQVAVLSAERDRLVGVVDRFNDLYLPMEADRLLLAELRKELPEARAEADAYLARLQQLALRSDPARLGPAAERMMDTAPAFLDWRDATFETQEEAARAYVDAGADAFGQSFTDLRNAILLTVAQRIDSVLSGIDRAR